LEEKPKVRDYESGYLVDTIKHMEYKYKDDTEKENYLKDKRRLFTRRYKSMIGQWSRSWMLNLKRFIKGQ
jgi:hypothetical protein